VCVVCNVRERWGGAVDSVLSVLVEGELPSVWRGELSSRLPVRTADCQQAHNSKDLTHHPDKREKGRIIPYAILNTQHIQ
jgi:hypothetical protein